MPPKIAYDALKTSLYTPYLASTIFSTSVTSVNPQVCAELSRLVYIPFEHDAAQLARLKHDLSLGGFELLERYNQKGTQAVWVQHTKSGQDVLAFRGTEPELDDLATDAQTWKETWPKEGKVHAGFKHAWEAVWPEIVGKYKNELKQAIFTGHSLGAALATLSASAVQANSRLITIGSPAVGDADFVATLKSILTERYVNCCDLVTRLPPKFLGFEQVGVAQYINCNGMLNSTAVVDRHSDQAQARIEYTVEYAWRFGTVLVRDLADHTPMNYIRAL